MFMPPMGPFLEEVRLRLALQEYASVAMDASELQAAAHSQLSMLAEAERPQLVTLGLLLILR